MSKCKYVLKNIECSDEYFGTSWSNISFYQQYYNGGYVVDKAHDGVEVSCIIKDGNVVVSPNEMHLFKKVEIDHTRV